MKGATKSDFPPTIGLKVDVDTYIGMRDNVPSLLRVFEQFNIKASFFISMGPDNSGKALVRIFRKEFFKMSARTRKIKKFPLRTLSYGSICKAPIIGSGNKDVIREVDARGHEVGIHGYDHVKWHEKLSFLTEEEIKDELSKSSRIYEDALSRKPLACASPGWRATDSSLRAEDSFGFIYHTDTRGTTPFFVKSQSGNFSTLEIPTTVLTFDEIYGIDGIREKEMPGYYMGEIGKSPLTIMTVHPELEGVEPGKTILKNLLQRLIDCGTKFLTLRDIAERCLKDKGKIPVCPIQEKMITGRSSKVAVQLC